MHILLRLCVFYNMSVYTRRVIEDFNRIYLEISRLLANETIDPEIPIGN